MQAEPWEESTIPEVNEIYEHNSFIYLTNNNINVNATTTNRGSLVDLTNTFNNHNNTNSIFLLF